MARYYSRSRSRSRRGRKGRRYNRAFLASVTGAFLVVVFLMFRGGSSGPQEAMADEETPATQPAPETQRISPPLAAVDTNYTGESVAAPTPVSVDPESLPRPITTNVGRTAVVTAMSPVVPNAKVETIIAEGLTLLQTRPQQVIAARNKLNEAMSLPMSPEQRREVTKQLTQLSEQWLFGPTVFPGDTLCETYNVRPGNLLQTIGGRHKVPYEIIMRINRIPRPEALQAGKTIKVPNGPFHVKVNYSTFTLDLYLQETYIRSFKVGLGREGYDTPTGLWRVRDGGKEVSPPWSDPDVQGRVLKAGDPDYPLGSRWIGLEGIEGAARGRTGFGIHGTKDPDEIGAAVSRGCIRMYNNDVILVYDCLVPLYSNVKVLD